ncbi:MAG: MucR family transcriptional regulator [Caulobacterales bacterium]
MADQNDLAAMTASIVSAYVENHQLKPSELPALIQTVHQALSQLGREGENGAERTAPAVSVKKSITSEYLVCLEDGRKFKSLKRHLRTRYNMTPEEYRAKWGLPPDYPMVAPNYARVRSNLAKNMGLGQSRKDG